MIREFLLKFSLNKRIIYGYAFLLGLYALLATIAIIVFFQAYARFVSQEKISRQQQLLQEIHSEVIVIDYQSQRFIADGHQSAIDRVALYSRKLESQLAEVLLKTSDPEMKNAYREMAQHLGVFTTTFQTVIKERTLRTKLVESDLPETAAVINKAFDSLEKDSALAQQKVRECRLLFLETRLMAIKYVEELDFRFVDIALGNLAHLNEKLQVMGRDNQKQKGEVAKVHEATQLYRAVLVRAVQATQSYLYLTNVVMAGEVSEFLYRNQQIQKLSTDSAQRANREAKASMVKAMTVLVGGLLFGVVFALLLAVRLSSSIIQPISRITDTFRSLADGEDVSEIPESELQDEMGDLARAAEKFRRKNKEVTELTLKTEAAEAANRAKSFFLANMSHELRTPLNAILGFSNLMRYEEGLSPDQRKTLDLINKSGEHLLTLINDVLDMAKIESGRVIVEDRVFDLGELVRDVIDLMDMRAKQKGLCLELDQSSKFPRFIKADQVKLRQILFNLVGNAVKFTSQGAIALRLDARPWSSEEKLLLVIEVEDTGPGISPENQQRVFEPFSQAGLPATQKGTGLGLTISRQYAELMGGTISLESYPGKGSKFRVEVPIGKGEEAEISDAALNLGRVLGLAAGQPEYRVLIVEDEMENWLLLRRLLEDAGFQVQVARNGAEGVEMFRSWMPHFIWMDIRMPVMNGLEATRQIRQLPEGLAVKIAACTASVFSEERDECLSAGMDDFIRKPYRADEVFECMARNLNVTFDYSENPLADNPEQAEVLQPEDFSGLSGELREELSNAVVSLDSDKISALIRRVTELNPKLGNSLAWYEGKLMYTEILWAIQPGGTNGNESFASGDLSRGATHE